jgi:hypothetical protein
MDRIVTCTRVYYGEPILLRKSNQTHPYDGTCSQNQKVRGSLGKKLDGPSHCEQRDKNSPSPTQKREAEGVYPIAYNFVSLP